MPGILPMKVIKVGTSSQSRIAQACDRCRSKKIRCDGVRPTCSQCANVGFECRTSDKLSRRAFPRGYTESLEERVRALEAEVRELKDLLDEKDEKIDILSKMDANRQRRTPGASPQASDPSDSRKDTQAPRHDTFRVQPTPLLLGAENSDSFFMGPSSGRCFIEAFKRKIQETGKPCGNFSPDAFLHIQGCQALTTETNDEPLRAPPRIFSDRCVNVYFQEWAPLFPVLHKPTFLRVYEEFVAAPDGVKSNYKIAQLYLVFGIAGLASDSPDLEQLAACEKQWIRALDSLLIEDTINTLQCLILALLYCTMRADYKRLQHYKGVAVSLSHRLGLHQSQKRFSFGALTIETRKKVFWTLYTLDCFTAAVLGLPKLLKEDDVQAEYPADTDDEYVTEKGFQPTLPGECTRLSSALALFRASRILAHVLEEIYPAVTPHELSLQQMGVLAEELDSWYEKLPSHLRLNFSQDKPSTDVTGSRSPLLALTYYFIRMLIYRPAVGSSLGPKAAPALLSIVEASKHIVQIMELLEERNMTFAMCLNKGDFLVICGMTQLYHRLELKPESKLTRDNERMVNAVTKMLQKVKASGLLEFKRVASGLVILDESMDKTSPSNPRATVTTSPVSQRLSLGVKTPKQRSTPVEGLSRHSWATVSESDLLQQQQKLRRMTMPSNQGQRPRFQRSISRQSFDNLQQSSPTINHSNVPHIPRNIHGNGVSPTAGRPRPDYMSIGNTSQSKRSSPGQSLMQPPTTMPFQHPRVAGGSAVVKSFSMGEPEWEAMLGAMDGGLNNVYDAIYGGGAGFAQETPTSGTANSNSDWSPDAWDLSTFNIGDFETDQAPARSVHSTSDESISPHEELMNSNMGQAPATVDFHDQLLSVDIGNPRGFIFEGLEAYPL